MSLASLHRASDASAAVIVEGAHRAGIEAPRAEHAQIRQALLELSPSADRGEMNPRKLESLHKLLSAQAAHESYSLYRWLEAGNRAGLHGSVSKVLEARAAANAERDPSITVPAIPSRMRAHLG